MQAAGYTYVDWATGADDPACGTKALPCETIGYAANNLLPLRMGEFLRIFLLRRRPGISPSSSLATIAVERVLDGSVGKADIAPAAGSDSAAESQAEH